MSPSESVTIDVTIETPRGSRNKLKYEPAKKRFSLSKILPEGMVFPYDFGFVPGTKPNTETRSMFWFLPMSRSFLGAWSRVR